MKDSTLITLFAIIVLGVIAMTVIIYQINHGLLIALCSIIGGLAGYKVGTKKSG